MVRDGAVKLVPVAQLTVDNDAHAPDKSCIPEFVKFVPRLLSVIV